MPLPSDLTTERLDDESAWSLAILADLPGHELAALDRLQRSAQQRTRYLAQAKRVSLRSLLHQMKLEMEGPVPGQAFWHDLHHPPLLGPRPHPAARKKPANAVIE